MVTLSANAKINLFLRVLGMRGDGFHEIESVFHSVSLADELTVASARDVSVSFSPSSPIGATNTVVHAATLLRERYSVDGGTDITVRKYIPTAAGLAGGSADAAAALIGLDRLWSLGLGVDELHELAQEIGSDVPYCLTGGACLVLGRGEELQPIPAPHEMWLVLGISNDPLLTRDVYAEWDRSSASPGPTAAPMALALGSGDIEEVATLLHNDLEPAAFRLRPELEGKKAEMARTGVLGTLMSGSGPTIFGLVRSRSDALEAAARASGHFDRIEVVRTVPSCVTVAEA